MSPDQPVTYQVADGVATITLAQPDSMNSLTTAVKEALKDALHRAGADSSARCVVLTGSGRAFCVGQDVREHAQALGSQPLDQVWSTVSEHYTPICLALATMPKPVVAAVNGVAAGAGASMAFACDFRIVSERAGFNTAFAGIGLSCDTGASWTLPRLVGSARALELLMLPRTVQADEALALGLATEVVPADQLDAAVRTLATKLAEGPTLAYASIRRAVAYSATHELSEALAFESDKMALTGSSVDHRNAVEAFVSKQQPTFEGR